MTVLRTLRNLAVLMILAMAVVGTTTQPAAARKKLPDVLLPTPLQ